MDMSSSNHHYKRFGADIYELTYEFLKFICKSTFVIIVYLLLELFFMKDIDKVCKFDRDRKMICKMM